MATRPYSTDKIACSLDIMIKIDEFRDKLDFKFKKMKRLFFWKMRILFQMEDKILKDKQPLMLRTLRLNEENLVKNLRYVRKGVALNPRKFKEILNGKNVHENVEF